MNSDKALEDLFLAQTPHFTDGDAFMASLTKRLDAVEYLKQYQERTIRRYKMAMVVAFVVGIISGAVSIAFILSTPADVPLFTFLDSLEPSRVLKPRNHVQTGILVWFAQNSRLFVASALSLLMTVGICSIISNVQDILHMRVRYSQPS